MKAIPQHIGAVNMDQVAYPVGIKQDAYYISTHFTLNPQTNTVSHVCTAVKNWFKEDEKLFTGTYQECHDFISNLITTHQDAVN